MIDRLTRGIGRIAGAGGGGGSDRQCHRHAWTAQLRATTAAVGVMNPLLRTDDAAAAPDDVPLIIIVFIQLTHRGRGGVIPNSEQEGSRHGQRPKDHGEKLASGLTEVNMTSDGGVPKGSSILWCADFSHKCRLCPVGIVPTKRKDPQSADARITIPTVGRYEKYGVFGNIWNLAISN